MKPVLISRGMNLLITAMLISILLMMGLTVHLENRLNGAQELRVTSLGLAEELQQSSQELTSAVRTYVVTGDMRYRDEYMKVLLRRNGQAARADGRTVPLKQLIIQAGISGEELRFLEAALIRSDELSALEKAAIEKMGEISSHKGVSHLVSSTHKTEAMDLLYNFKYRSAVEGIMEPINRFNDLVNQRTELLVQRDRFNLHTILLVNTLLILLTAFVYYLAPSIVNQFKNQDE